MFVPRGALPASELPADEEVLTSVFTHLSF